MARVRRCEIDDAPALYALRLNALQRDPRAFLTTLEEEQTRGAAGFAERMRQSARDPACATFGAYLDGALCGMVGTFRIDRPRVVHKAHIWGLWVAPRARRCGLARELLQAVIDELRAVEGIEQVHLTVTTGQTDAIALYRDLGFESYGLERRSMKLGPADYVDEELFVYRLL